MRLNILYCSDNNYAPYLGVSMMSLLESNRDAEEIIFYVVSDRISEENIERLKRQVAKYGDKRVLKLIDGRQWIEQLVSMKLLPYRGGLTTNLRLFFLEYIDQDVDRLLYLDCDTIIQGSLSELFSMSMDGAPAAAVLDSLSGKEYKKIIGFSPEESYFNAGVLFVDVENWRKNDCQGRLSALMNDPSTVCPNNDQDFLNIALRNQKRVIHPKYNFQTTHKVYSDRQYYSAYSKKNYYTVQELKEARETPTVIHAYRFLGHFPWHKQSAHPYRDMFWELVTRSEWSDLKSPETKGAFFKAERILYRILPKGLFLRIFKAWQCRTFKKRAKEMEKNKNRGTIAQ